MVMDFFVCSGFFGFVCLFLYLFAACYFLKLVMSIWKSVELKTAVIENNRSVFHWKRAVTFTEPTPPNWTEENQCKHSLYLGGFLCRSRLMKCRQKEVAGRLSLLLRSIFFWCSGNDGHSTDHSQEMRSAQIYRPNVLVFIWVEEAERFMQLHCNELSSAEHFTCKAR